MEIDLEKKFIKDNTISKEEFMAQFEEESMEIVVQVRDCWKKGNRPFPKFGKESLASMDYVVPWLDDPEGPLGAFGQIFWFCKKSLFGYPYKPEFKSDRICLYRLRVRPGRFSNMPKVRYFFLEEVLEEDVDLIKDDAVYKSALERYYKDVGEKVSEMTVLIKNEIDISKLDFLSPYSVNKVMKAFKAVRFADTGKAGMIDGQLEIPFDERDFNGNRNLKLAAGSIIRITARRRTASGIDNLYVLDKLLESDVEDDELRNLNGLALKPGKWHVNDEIGDLDVNDGEAMGLILWDPSDNSTEVNVTLTCDSDNPKSAALAADHLINALGNKTSFEAKIFDAIAENLVDENGMIETWEGENEGDATLTKEEFISRLSIVDLMFEPDGSGSAIVSLDGMFTDHAYTVDLNADGTAEAQGLIG